MCFSVEFQNNAAERQGHCIRVMERDVGEAPPPGNGFRLSNHIAYPSICQKTKAGNFSARTGSLPNTYCCSSLLAQKGLISKQKSVDWFSGMVGIKDAVVSIS